MYSYQIHRIFNNPTSSAGYNVSLNRDGSRMIVSKNLLPAYLTGSSDTYNGSFQVYAVDYDSRKNIRLVRSIGETVHDDDVDNFAAGIDMTDDGTLVMSTSNDNIFRIYKFNSGQNRWDSLFTPGLDHGVTNVSNVAGIRGDSDFSNIITASVDNETGITKLIYYRRESLNVWSRPAYSNGNDFIDRFNGIRGLVISDPVSTIQGTGPVALHIQAVSPTNVSIFSTLLGENDFYTHGTFPAYDNFDAAFGIAVGITPNGQNVAVTRTDNNSVYIDMYKWDSDDWFSVASFEIPIPDANGALNYIYMTDARIGELPQRFCLSMNFGLSNDSIYGVYKINFDGNVYTPEQEVSFHNKLLDLTDGEPVSLAPFGTFPSTDLSVVAVTFMGPDPDDNPNTNPPYSAIQYRTYPSNGIKNVGNIDTAGVGFALFVNASDELPPRHNIFVNPTPPAPTPPAAAPAAASAATVVTQAAVVVSLMFIIFLIFFL